MTTFVFLVCILCALVLCFFFLRGCKRKGRVIFLKDGKEIRNMLLTTDQKVSFSVAFVDAAGNPAKVDGVPEWASSDETVITLTVADDGLSGEAVAAGTVGQAQVTVKADADLGDGVEELIGTLDLEVVSGKAVAVRISTGAPEPK